MSKNYGIKKYFFRIGVALDQLLNTILAGSSQETLSSRAYRCAHLTDVKKWRWKVAEKVINWIFFLQKEHCRKAYDSIQNGDYEPS